MKRPLPLECCWTNPSPEILQAKKSSRCGLKKQIDTIKHIVRARLVLLRPRKSSPGFVFLWVDSAGHGDISHVNGEQYEQTINNFASGMQSSTKILR